MQRELASRQADALHALHVCQVLPSRHGIVEAFDRHKPSASGSPLAAPVPKTARLFRPDRGTGHKPDRRISGAGSSGDRQFFAQPFAA